MHTMSSASILTLLLGLLHYGQGQGLMPQMSPFFFLCNYHGNVQELGQTTNEVKLSVAIAGNPYNYVPGNFYQVSVTSSLNFDAFLMTGLYTISTAALSQIRALGVQGSQPLGQNLMCSIVHTLNSREPVHQFQFVWIAPPAGTGCVSFLATATLAQQVLFRDTTVLQLCEEGAPTIAPLRPALAELHSDTIIFRDDFDSFDHFGPDHWSAHEGGSIGQSCGSIFHGDAMVMCEKIGRRELITRPLNTTTAAILQYVIGAGTCGSSDLDQKITVSFGLNNCQDWYHLSSFSPPEANTEKPGLHILHLPPKARSLGVCFAWRQAPTVPDMDMEYGTTHADPTTVTTTQKSIATKVPVTTKTSTSATTTTARTTTTTTTTTTTSATTTAATPTSTTTSSSGCQLGMFQCASRNTDGSLQCFSETQRCDGFPDCLGEITDEENCFSTFCNEGLRACNGECIPITADCDFKIDELQVNDAPAGDDQNPILAPMGSREGTYEGCWSVDHVIIVNTADPPSTVTTGFDPVDPSDWLAFPGAHFKHQCHSDDNAMVFDHKAPVTGAGLRDMDLSPGDVSADVILQEDFESKFQPGWDIIGGHVDMTCGIIHQSNSMVFDAAGKNRKICTPYLDSSRAGNVRFYFSLGSGRCHSSGEKKAKVIVYVEDESDHTLYIIEKLAINSYKEPRLVSLPLSPVDREPQVRICWLQKYNGGRDSNVWAIDNIQVLPYMPQRAAVDKHKMAQFSMNLHCGNFPEDNDVELLYSTSLGETWFPLHKSCLPGQCTREYFPVTTTFHATDFDRWRRVTVPLPYAALVPYVRFRWMKTSNDEPNWALDNVYVGACTDGCNGHGRCQEGSCLCDFGYTGPTCKATVMMHPMTIMENFEDPDLFTSSSIENIQGASLGFQCDVVSTDKAVVFNKDGHRQLVTGEIDTRNSMYFQFNIRVGSNSPVSDCPPPDETKELVILDYSCNGGVTWNLLKTFNIHEYRQPKSDSVLLPQSARDNGCKFRWWQPEHSGSGRDVWALDDLSLNDHLFNMLHLRMANMKDIGDRLTVTHGQLNDGYCRKMRSLSFIGEHVKNDLRFVTTESMHVGPGYIIQFELVMGCGLWYSEGIDNRLYLEYSSDHGIHWHLVRDPCLPPAPCKYVEQGTIYDWTQYPEWTRVTVPLPATTWGPATRFRIRQSNWEATDTWAISRLYIGQQCPEYCSGHGECNEGICACDKGFEGAECHPATHLDDLMQADFGIRYDPDADFLHVRGGKVASNNRGCGNIHSGESMYFFDNGVRELVTEDRDTRRADYLHFHLRIGGEDPDCNGGDHRSESVLVQYSNNGGITWILLDELLHTQYTKPRLVANDLPSDARTPNTRFRWWQPSHSGKGHDQWAIDEIRLGQYSHLRSMEDNFDDSVDAMDSGMWLTAADGIVGKYCMSSDPTVILANNDNNKRVITSDLELKAGDVIQFKINVGCSNQFRWDHPVMLQYWQRGRRGFSLLQEPCYQQMEECDGPYTEGSIYYSGPHGHWQLVVIPITQELAKHPIMLRWWQRGGYEYNFALDDVYIGPPCPDNCHRHGTCSQGVCSCEEGYSGVDCQSDDPTPYGMVDRFEQLHRPSDFWRRVWGGHLGTGCGAVDSGNALFFEGDGTREAVTVPLNTTYLRMLEFVLKIGSTDEQQQCTQAQTQNEGVIVDFSTDNEITWQPLKLIEPQFYNGTVERVVLELPPEAKSDRTIYRWWQPLGYGGMPRSEWGLDSVTIGVNETNLAGFQDDFTGRMADMFTWFQTESAVPRITCNSKGNALEFSRTGEHRYAETWDYQVTPSTFLQFDIAMGCDSLYGTLYEVMLEFSTNMGKQWSPLMDGCAPPHFQCSGYHLSSNYQSDQHRNWTRISVYLPPAAVSPATRFRWQQHNPIPSGNVWALDNIYLGEGCPWLCSGHGQCRNRKCMCDAGYTGESCVPSKPLPMMLRDDFNREKPKNDNWLEVYGGDLTTMCGTLVSGNALTFSEDHLRMAISRDIDTTMLNTIEFYFLYGCDGKQMDWPRRESVLLQYSNNGGITWNILQEMHYRNYTGPRFFSLELPMKARHNSTRFRFWQPAYSGKMLSTWAVDNLFLGRMTMNPSSMQDDFNNGVQSDSWLFVNDGEVGPYCEANTRADTLSAGHSALLFKHGPDAGEHSVVTRDLDVGPMSVLQFDINVGCDSEPTHKYPVRLEFSSDGGKTWNLVVPNCADVSSALCYDSHQHASLYYGGTSRYWRRVSIPLDRLYVCGSLRFRWFQGFIPEDDFGPEWAVDNIFIGMACMEHCLGRGACSDTMMCSCDPGYHGDTCAPNQALPIYMKEGFSLADKQEEAEEQPQLDSFVTPDELLDETKWDIWSGGLVSDQCGLLVDGTSLVFGQTGERTLVTRELDLSKATTVQFYIRLGCNASPPDPATPPVYLQYTTNGGIAWYTIEQFDFNLNSNVPAYIVLNLPEKSRSPASQLRWWQPSKDGKFMDDWAIDQVYIGGDYDGVAMLSDEPKVPRDPNWTMNPGGVIEPACDSTGQVIHFTGEERYRFAVTADVVVADDTFLQFDLSMGCTKPNYCFSIQLDYSLDMGTTWRPLFAACKPSNVDCNKHYYPDSRFKSDYYYGWNRVTLPLGYYAKSKATRFRWRQPEGYSVKDTWAIANLHVGSRSDDSNCPAWCSGHGRCTPTGCICDVGWGGTNCVMPTSMPPQYFYDMFEEENKNLKVVGGKRKSVCQVLASGLALHFTGDCTRMLKTGFLDLSSAAFIQFYFMYGCHDYPDSLDESVIISYSTDGVLWTNFGILHFKNYKKPTFVSIKLPADARHNGTQISLAQMEHHGSNQDDWVIDDLRIGGDLVNPDTLVSDFSFHISPAYWNTLDNMEDGEYCDAVDVAIGNTLEDERSTLTTRDLNIKQGHMLQFWYNIGCMRPWDIDVAPIHLQYSVDNGVTWSYVVPQCLSNDPDCLGGASMASVYYGDPMGRWQRVTIPLEGMTVSSGTRFRWQQRPLAEVEAITDWAIKDVYIGPQCDSMCGGHGNCHFPACSCDDGYRGHECYPWYTGNPSELKDTFEEPELDKSQWSLVQGGAKQDPCANMVEGSALVHSGPGMRQAVTVDMDLRDARFVQYFATIGGQGAGPGCTTPRSLEEGVILQYSSDGGIHWQTLHTLDYSSYTEPRRDYVTLPQEARTSSTRLRWWQPLADDPGRHMAPWAIDNVYIGGKEINPAEFKINFTKTHEINDEPWEFNPYGRIRTEICKRDGSVIQWEAGSGVRHFTTKQMIVQSGYILQFKIAVGCSQTFNICIALSPVRLQYNKNPVTDTWLEVTPLCLPDLNQRMDCRPNMFHTASEFTPDTYPLWTRVTISLPEKTYSSLTRFRWLQEATDATAPDWALDDIYVGETCPDMCHGRGDCHGSKCECDDGYSGPSCLPVGIQLTRMFDSFESGIYTSHWEWVSGGGIGFGCGALLPYAHGKTLYFNGCGSRQARTVEMDLRRASKVMFVLQIGCQAQTPDCNVKTEKESSQYRGILLQYTTNKGSDWMLIARHDPADHLTPKRLAYDIPPAARTRGAQFRWWQPVNGGEGYDQWAIDHVEIVHGRHGMAFYRRRRNVAKH